MFRILVVDDEYINRCLLIDMLNRAGYHDCIEASSGEEALALVNAQVPDMILLDVVMPGISGLDVAPRLKAFSPECYLPILFITALDDKQSLVNCLNAGGDDFVPKPFDSVVLIAKIKAHERSRLMSLEIADQKQSLYWYQQDVERNHKIVEHIFSKAIAESNTLQQHFSYHIQPQTRFNGDVLLCEQSPSGGAYLFVGDFTGHGLASAIGAIPVAKAFSSMTKKGCSVSTIAKELNNTLVAFLPADMFCVASILEIDATGTSMTVWNGGMPRLALRQSNGQINQRIESHHMPLGILDADEFDNRVEQLKMQVGDTLLIYTDGLMEVTHPELGIIGEHGVEKWFVEHEIMAADAFVSLARKHRQGQPPGDDTTIVLFHCHALTSNDQNTPDSSGVIPFKTQSTLTYRHIKQHNVCDFVTQKLAVIEGLESLRSDIFTVTNELLNNAIEHGLLKLPSDLKHSEDGFEQYYVERNKRLSQLCEGHLDVFIDCDPDNRQLKISVTDSGDGYDVNALNNHDCSDDLFGRGMMLMEEICQSVDVINDGRTTVATLSF